MKINVPGNGLPLQIGKGNEATVFGNNIPVHLLEKMIRLGGKAVLAAGQAIQAAEFSHCLSCFFDPDFDLFLFRLLDVPAGAVAEARIQGLLALCEVEGMAEVSDERTGCRALTLRIQRIVVG